MHPTVPSIHAKSMGSYQNSNNGYLKKNTNKIGDIGEKIFREGYRDYATFQNDYLQLKQYKKSNKLLERSLQIMTIVDQCYKKLFDMQQHPIKMEVDVAEQIKLVNNMMNPISCRKQQIYFFECVMRNQLNHIRNNLFEGRYSAVPIFIKECNKLYDQIPEEMEEEIRDAFLNDLEELQTEGRKRIHKQESDALESKWEEKKHQEVHASKKPNYNELYEGKLVEYQYELSKIFPDQRAVLKVKIKKVMNKCKFSIKLDFGCNLVVPIPKSEVTGLPEVNETTVSLIEDYDRWMLKTHKQNSEIYYSVHFDNRVHPT